jgi:predicted transposase/invertase (TIGR01784 family)
LNVARCLIEVESLNQKSKTAMFGESPAFRYGEYVKPVSDDPLVPIVFAEAQMQTDENFYRRYFAEIFLYLEQYEVSRSWQGLLILPSRGLNFGAELPYQELLEHRVTRLYLQDLKEESDLSPNLALLQLLVTDRNQSADLGRALLEKAETEIEFERRLSLIETILANKFPDLTKEMIMQILDLKQMDITQSLFYQEIIQEGRQKGLQEGRQEGEAGLVIRLLRRRLGQLADNHVEQIQKLSVPQLEDLGEALLDYTEMADLVGFLAKLE